MQSCYTTRVPDTARHCSLHCRGTMPTAAARVWPSDGRLLGASWCVNATTQLCTKTSDARQMRVCACVCVHGRTLGAGTFWWLMLALFHLLNHRRCVPIFAVQQRVCA